MAELSGKNTPYTLIYNILCKTEFANFDFLKKCSHFDLETNCDQMTIFC